MEDATKPAPHDRNWRSHPRHDEKPERHVSARDPLCVPYLWTVHPQIQARHRVAQHDHVSPRENSWLKSCKAQGLHIFVTLKTLVIHMSCPHPSPHLIVSTSTSSLCHPFHPPLLPFRRCLLYKQASLVLDPQIPCDGPPQSGGSTKIPSLTGYEPKSVEINAIDTRSDRA